MDIGSKIRKRRTEKGYSQEYLSEQLNISQATLSNIENNKSVPDVFQLKKLSEVLEVSIHDLLEADRVIIHNVDNNHGVGHAEVINQLSEKLIKQYEERIKELKQIIEELRGR